MSITLDPTRWLRFRSEQEVPVTNTQFRYSFAEALTARLSNGDIKKVDELLALFNGFRPLLGPVEGPLKPEVFESIKLHLWSEIQVLYQKVIFDFDDDTEKLMELASSAEKPDKQAHALALLENGILDQLEVIKAKAKTCFSKIAELLQPQKK